MKKGGYQIIDLKGKQFTLDEGIVFKGIYDTIEGTTKPKLFSGINIGGTKYADTFCELTRYQLKDGGSYVGTIYGKTISIEYTDFVTIAE